MPMLPRNPNAGGGPMPTAPRGRGLGRGRPAVLPAAVVMPRNARAAAVLPGDGGPPLRPVAMAKGGAVNQHKRMAMGEKVSGMKKGGKV